MGQTSIERVLLVMIQSKFKRILPGDGEAGTSYKLLTCTLNFSRLNFCSRILELQNLRNQGNSDLDQELSKYGTGNLGDLGTFCAPARIGQSSVLHVQRAPVN